MDLPDVIGYTLERAVQRLTAAGTEEIDVEVLNPPRCAEAAFDNSFRVVRSQAVNGNTVKLLVCKPL